MRSGFRAEKWFSWALWDLGPSCHGQDYKVPASFWFYIKEERIKNLKMWALSPDLRLHGLVNQNHLALAQSILPLEAGDISILFQTAISGRMNNYTVIVTWHMLTKRQPSLICLVSMISFIPYNNPMKQVLLLLLLIVVVALVVIVYPFYRWENWDYRIFSACCKLHIL